MGTRETTAKLLFTALIALALWQAWTHRFVQDDAFISFRYARNLLEHGTLAFNPGEAPVEGYSNFAGVLLVAAGMALGADPVHASWAIGVSAFVGSLSVGWLWLKERYPQTLLPRVLLFLLPLNASCAAYATGGLSTALFAFGVVGSCWLAQRRPLHWHSAAACSVLLLIRPEAPLVVGLLAAAALLRDPRAWRRWLRWLCPVLLTTGLYASFKAWTFGALLPNTAHAKSVGVPYFSSGLAYLGAFVRDAPHVLLIPAALLLTLRHRAWRPAAAIVASFVFYVAWVGGGFMEYKALMHIAPLAVLCLAGAVGAVLTSRGEHWQRPAWAGAAVLLGISGLQRPDPPAPILSTPLLWSQVRPDGGEWSKIGRRLGELLPPETTIAVTAAGAIPFHSRLRSVDMLGLTEAAIARQALGARGTVGHEKHASLDYLRGRGVHLVVGHPTQVSPERAKRYARETLYIHIDSRWLQTQILDWTPALDRAVQENPTEFRIGDQGSRSLYAQIPPASGLAR